MGGLAKRWHAVVYLVPFPATAANCSLKRSCSSMITPRNLCDVLGAITRPDIVIGMRLTGSVFLGLLGSFRRMLQFVTGNCHHCLHPSRAVLE